MSKRIPTPVMTHNSSQYPHSPDSKAPSAAGGCVASRDGTQRLASVPGSHGPGGRDLYRGQEERRDDSEKESQGERVRKMDIWTKMPSILFVPITLKSH